MSSGFQSNGFQSNGYQIGRVAFLTGTGGIDQKGSKKSYLPAKPTGLSPKKRAKAAKLDKVVQDVEQIALEVAEQITLEQIGVSYIDQTSLAEMGLEIESSLGSKQRIAEEKRRIAMLLIMLAANS